ncbi:MAG: FkbM family methyltransferase [Rhodobacteraceae bacterium]|nr:FkbM family methyltransferase [Paracoccaceae bacterium]
MEKSVAREFEYLETCNVRIPFDRRIITPPIEQAILADQFEAEEAAQIPLIVQEGDTVLDIGAGIGFISTLLARQSGVKQVISVEANPDLMPFMESLHLVNNVHNIERVNAVLTNCGADSMAFYQRNDFWMGSLMAGPNPYERKIEVATKNLNALLRDRAVDLIVCDIEGAEAMIFADADLAGVDRIYLELHDHITGLCGVKSVFDQLSSKGFAFDPRHSNGAIVLFRRVQKHEVLRPYARLAGKE